MLSFELHSAELLTRFLSWKISKLQNSNFSKFFNYSRHLTIILGNIYELILIFPYRYTCELCGKIFSAKPYLHAHQKMHLDTRCMKKCSICDKVVTRRHYSQHLRYHDPSTWKHKCLLCQEKFMTLYKLYEHESTTHTGQPRFKCPQCEELFHTTARRAFHKKTCLGTQI